MTLSKSGPLKFDPSWLQIVVIPLLTTALTLAGALWQLNSTNERADHVRFMDGAQATAQETGVLLDEGRDALSKLIDAPDNVGWQQFSRGSWKSHRDFHRDWRQRLVVAHFRLARYFGKDLADQLVHIDEIDLHPAENLPSQHLCEPAGRQDDFDVSKLAEQTECITRMIAVEQDVFTQAKMDKKTDDLFQILEAERKHRDLAQKLLDEYDKATVRFLRQLDQRLTRMGQAQVERG